jgi:outer membrane protein assembly factor BamB
MTRLTALAGLLIVLAAGLFALHGETPKPAAKPDKAEACTDILASVKEWNSDKYASPPTKFREGHVTPRELDKNAVTETKGGFVIKLPSGAPVPTPSVYDGKLYVSGGFHSKEFYCFDAQTGKVVWGVNLDDDGPTAAACQDGVIVFNTESCTIFALDAKSGKQLWSLWLGDPLTNTPTIAGGKVFTAYPARGGGGVDNAPGKDKGAPPARAKEHPPCSHVLAAFDLKSGKILWQRWIDSDVMSAPVAVDKELYVTSFSGVVYKFNQEDGAMLSAMKSRATSAPVVVGKDVFFTRRADDGKGKAAEAITGAGRSTLRPDWEGDPKVALYLDKEVQDRSKLKGASKDLDAGNGFPAGAPASANAGAGYANVGQSNVSSLQAFQGSRILNYRDFNFNCMGDECICTDPKTGKAKWTFKLEGDLKTEGGFLAAPPAAAGGQLFLATLNGEILQMDPAKGKVVQRHKVGSQVRFQPAIEGGKLYVSTQDGKVVCIDAGDKKFTGWPCWGGNAAHTGLREEKADK